jgi:hypothetical protein
MNSIIDIICSAVTKVIDDHVQTLLTVFLECNRVANSLKTRIEDRDRDYSILLRAVQNTLYPHSRSASESCPISATKSVGSNAPATSITSQDCDSSVCAVTRRLCAQLAHQLYGLEKRCSGVRDYSISFLNIELIINMFNDQSGQSGSHTREIAWYNSSASSIVAALSCRLVSIASLCSLFMKPKSGFPQHLSIYIRNRPQYSVAK